jgi:hypothetical protein
MRHIAKCQRNKVVLFRFIVGIQTQHLVDKPHMYAYRTIEGGLEDTI